MIFIGANNSKVHEVLGGKDAHQLWAPMLAFGITLILDVFILLFFVFGIDTGVDFFEENPKIIKDLVSSISLYLYINWNQTYYTDNVSTRVYKYIFLLKIAFQNLFLQKTSFPIAFGLLQFLSLLLVSTAQSNATLIFAMVIYK